MRTLLKIYKRAFKYKNHIIVASLATLFITLVNLFAPRVTQEVIKILSLEGETSELLKKLFIITASLLGLYILRSIAQFVQNYIGHKAAWGFVSQIRGEIYAHLQTLSPSFFASKKTGELMSRIVNDTADFEMLIAHAVPELFSGIILFVGVGIMLFMTNVTLAFLTLIPIPFILLSAPLFKKTRQGRRGAQKHMGELNAMLQDNLTGMKEIQLWGKEESESERVFVHSRKHAGAIIDAVLYMAIMNPIVGFLTSAGNVIVVGFGGYLALSGHGMAIDEVVAFLLYLGVFYTPVANIARVIEDMQSGIAGGERVLELLGTRPDISDSNNARDVSRLNGSISFRNISFSYPDEPESFVFKNVSFDVGEKKMFAIIGQTGVGKTTLAALLPRFYDVVEGEILIDDIPIKDMTLKSLRSNIGMVLQDVFLWGGTIRENIVYAKPDASDDEVIEAAKMACIHEFIKSLPQGYDTVVGERGIRLSGGQKQRISIARSILSDATILILDEATSAVDTETEREIQNAISKIAGSKTLIVIAHRLSTVKRADCIVVLKNNSVAEMGTHNELIEKNGVYKKLVDVQSIV